MISQRTRGLHHTLLLCQALLIGLGLWVAMDVAFTIFTEASSLHRDRYPIYGAVLIIGLVMETLIRDAQEIAANLFQRNIYDQHKVSLRQTFFAAGMLFLYLAAAKDAFISRTFLAVDLPLIYLTLLWSNYTLPRILSRIIFGEQRMERALLIGSVAHSFRFRTWLKSKEDFGFKAVGNLSAADEPGVPWVPWLGEYADLERVLVEQQITQVIFLSLPDSSERYERLVKIVEDHGTRMVILNNLEEKLRHRAVHFEDGGLDFIAPRAEPLEDPLNRWLKRLLDLVVAVPIVFLVLPPLALVVWICQRLQSPGPLFYRQIRAGIQNRQFTIIKFRTMHVTNTEEARQASEGDERIYRAGRWLRRLSLDEIPQFLNVIAGEMSVCGPRPHLVEHNADFARRMARYHVRTFVKPGVTGLAQVRGFRGEVHDNADIEHRLESDLAYIENWRLALDLMIIFRTALQMALFAGNRLLRGGGKAASTEEMAAMGSEVAVVPLHGSRATYVPDALRRNFRQILGIRFFTGTAFEAVAIGMQGGLVVAPSAPVLLGLEVDPVHRAAVRGSALAITDSGLMVLLWKLLTGEDATRVSGLVYLKMLLEQPPLRVPGSTFWVMPSTATMERTVAWLQRQGFAISADDCYVAPQYAREDTLITDPALVELVRSKRPAHVIMAVGGGVQEKLGAELLKHLDYLPAVHCTGAAIGFLTGEQAPIPMWADRFRLGWLFRCLYEPAKFVPRYWEARKLVSLMLHYHGRLPGGYRVPTPANAGPR